MIEARLALDQIGSSNMPKIAWDALEAGLDGPAIRRLAALDSPTYFEVKDVLPKAMQEMGLVQLTRGQAALRLARKQAEDILQSGGDPLEHTRDFENLWIDAGYPSELTCVGTLYDDVYIARGNQSDNEIRQWIIAQLKKFISGGETK